MNIFAAAILIAAGIMIVGMLILWLTIRAPEEEWEYGQVEGRRARRHRNNGNVQFVLWEAGSQGHHEDFWHDFDPSWWPLFNKKQAVKP
ncbi:hypothetical protein GALL_71810 [mine drainage metagenome]|uniref:Uncharacterized protein n=1 Tax=mine drainage metagenome TaxID=410659 RepID=A0A1J5SR69_9ZZZZ